VIITGTGRAGTTFLVELMTVLGMDTGFSDASSEIYENCRAGMEWDLRDSGCPYVVKDPQLCNYLAAVLEDGQTTIDRAIVPIRDLHSAAESRRAVAAMAGSTTGVPGGLWLTDKPEQQESVLTAQLYELFHTLARHDIPTTILYFPRLATDPYYLFKKLSPVLVGIDAERFFKAFQEVARPELIRDFASAARAVDPGAEPLEKNPPDRRDDKGDEERNAERHEGANRRPPAR
jgi:hypothetical protein